MGQSEGVSKGVRVAVVGGGAAGFFGAIAAADANPHSQVTLYEAGPQPLAKVRISGGGRCNVTHHCFDPAVLVQNYPRGGKALRGAFSRFQPKDTVEWFAQRGVKLKTEADGRMFPTTDDSETIVDCLMGAARQAGVTIKTRSPITGVEKLDDTFQLQLRGQAGYAPCDRLLLATGSSPAGQRIARSLGHSLEPAVPSLFTFNVADQQLHLLSGVAVDPVTLRLSLEGLKKPLTQTGPLLITHWGLSGPAILKLSAWGARELHTQHYCGGLTINWLPAETQDQIRAHLQQAKAETPKRLIATYSPYPSISKRLWQYLLSRIGIEAEQTWANLSKKQINQLVTELSQGRYEVGGKGMFKDEFVTCGGVKLKEVNFKTMESSQCEGLYLAGELLDIDGITGGFNFQSAWTTGWLAGQAMGG
ncbi:MAG: putative oxidoreductase with FAD/NAD(P)-binding domain YhiN [Phormidesmis priestleyi Ana]|uniref:Putative oxidoreductase with FAD/NAD(P)-binding domain YhiN n=1 Tax=Phormidesmis priestleyi Ana TaxID=1666911 RepID=A0A0P7YTH7_9CYAN|nr:MAG: putative oxidoreductase with FAD/NAD(P)-binding domain YhiN [Phormidesmis priestleyi Ana]